MKPFLKSLPSALLVLLFVYAALSKLLDFSEFREELYRQSLPREMADILRYLLPAAELATAALLLFGKTSLEGLISSLALLIIFTGYITLVLLHYWEHKSCSCGGILSHMSWKGHLWFNCAFILLNLIAIVIHFKERRPVT